MESSIIIPVFNEEKSIREILDVMIELEYDKRYEVIIVNDGSYDKTAEILQEYPFKIINHNYNKGYGAALKTGIRKASGRNIITFDSDGQHNPAYIPEIENLLIDNELVIGERDNKFLQPKNRKWGKKIIRFVGEYLVNQKLPDFNSGYRGFKSDIIKGLLHIMPNGFSFSTTSTLAFIKEGYSLATFPIQIQERQGRKSNVKSFSDGTKTILLLFRIIMLFNPLKVFFPASLIITILGIVYGIYGYIVFNRFPNTAVIVFLVGIFMFFIGLLADQIAIINRKLN